LGDFQKSENIIETGIASSSQSPSSVMSGLINKPSTFGMEDMLKLGLQTVAANKDNKSSSLFNFDESTIATLSGILGPKLIPENNVTNDPKNTDNKALIANLLNKDNLKELILGIDEELINNDKDLTYCHNKFLEILDNLFDFSFTSTEEIDKKKITLQLFDKLLKYEKEHGLFLTKEDFFNKCFRFKENKNKHGLLKIVFFLDELRQDPSNLQLLFTIPMVTVSLMGKKWKDAGKSIGKTIKMASAAKVSISNEQ